MLEHPEVFEHVGLLVNEPPGTDGLPFTWSSDNFPIAFPAEISPTFPGTILTDA